MENDDPRNVILQLLERKGMTAYLLAPTVGLTPAAIYNFLRKEKPTQMGIDNYLLIKEALEKMPDKS